MRLRINVVLILLCAFPLAMLNWWAVAIACFLFPFITDLQPGKSFRAGFYSISLLWLILSLRQDIPNQHILSIRMAALFHLPHYSLFIIVAALIGGLLGALSAWSGGMMRRALNRK